MPVRSMSLHEPLSSTSSFLGQVKSDAALLSSPNELLVVTSTVSLLSFARFLQEGFDEEVSADCLSLIRSNVLN